MSDLEFEPLSCQPAVFYYRTALRIAKNKREAQKVGLMLADEVEHLKEQIRGLGYIPARLYDPKTLIPDDQLQLALELLPPQEQA